MMNSTRNTTTRASLLRVAASTASLGALAVTTLTLVGDSADCPDGYKENVFAANYTSDCPTLIADPQGTLRLNVRNSDAPEPKIAMRAAGIRVARLSEASSSPGVVANTCNVTAVALQFDKPEIRKSDCVLALEQKDQTLICTIPSQGIDASTTPPAPRDAATETSVSLDASDDAASDAAPTTDAGAGGRDAAEFSPKLAPASSQANTGGAPDAGAGSLVQTCQIKFTPIAL
jgi:hypothetical protein